VKLNPCTRLETELRMRDAIIVHSLYIFMACVRTTVYLAYMLIISDEK